MKGSIKGKVIAVLSVQSGTSKKGTEWRKQSIVIECSENPEKYEKHLSLDFWGEVSNEASKLNVGDVCDFECEASSKEYQGNWYTNVGCWKFKKLESTQTPAQQVQEPISETIDDNLPF